MRDIFSLIKIDLYAAFTTGSSARKKKKKPQTKALSLSGGRKTGLSGGKAGATLLGLFLFALIAFNFYTSGITMGGLLAESGHLEILLSSSYALATVLVLSMCIFKMPSYLYSFKDFDLLMSLPLRTSHILVSKLASLYAVNLLYAAAFGGPTMVAYGVLTGAGAQYYIMAALGLLFVPVLAMVAGGVLAFLLGLVAARSRSGNLVMVIGSIFIMLAIMGASMFLGSMGVASVDITLPIFQTIDKILFPALLLIPALTGQSWPLLFAYLGVCAALAALFCGVFAKSFRRINALMRETFSGRAYKMRGLKRSSVYGALVRKELKTFFSMPDYVLNSGIGLVLLTIASIVMLFAGGSIAQALNGLAEILLPGIAAATILFLLGMTNITQVSVSLEGNRLWLLKSLPIGTRTVLRAKLTVPFIVVTPLSLIDAALIGLGLGLSSAQIGLLLLEVLCLSTFSTVFGLTVNLLLPKLDWKNPITVIKQSASSSVAVLVSLLLCIGLILLYVLGLAAWISIELYILLLCIFFAALSLFFFIWLRTAGIKRFDRLEV